MISVVLLGPWGCFDRDEAMVKIHRMRMTTHLEFPKFCSLFSSFFYCCCHEWILNRIAETLTRSGWSSTQPDNEAVLPKRQIISGIKVRLNQKTNLFPLPASAQKKENTKERERERHTFLHQFLHGFICAHNNRNTNKSKKQEQENTLIRWRRRREQQATKLRSVFFFLSFLTSSGLWYTERVIVI